MFVLGMVAVDEDVDADAQPGWPHDHEQLGEQDQLVAGVLE